MASLSTPSWFLGRQTTCSSPTVNLHGSGNHKFTSYKKNTTDLQKQYLLKCYNIGLQKYFPNIADTLHYTAFILISIAISISYFHLQNLSQLKHYTKDHSLPLLVICSRHHAAD